MPNANATFLNSYSDLNSILASNIEPALTPSMLKGNTHAFTAGQLLARDAGGEVVPFTWTAEAADVPFAGFCLEDVSEDATDVRVVTQGAIRVGLLQFAEVTESDGTTVSNFTLDKFLALTSIAALVYDEFTFQGYPVMKLMGVEGQYTA